MEQILTTIFGALVKFITDRQILKDVVSWISGNGKWVLVGLIPFLLVVGMCFWICLKSSEMIVQIQIPRLTGIERVKFQVPGGEHLYNYFRPNYEEFKVRIENKHMQKDCFHFVMMRKSGTTAGLEMAEIHPTFLIQAQRDQRVQRDRGDADVKLKLAAPSEGSMGIKYTYNGRTVMHPPLDLCGGTTQTALARPWVGSVPDAFAQNDAQISNQILIESLKSDDYFLRFEAQQILSARGPSVVRSTAAALDKLEESSVEWKRLAASTVGIIEEMLERGVNSRLIRENLKSRDEFKPLVMMLDHPHPRTRYDAATVLLILRDSRSLKFVADIVGSNSAGKSGKYNAALVLVNLADRLSEEEMNYLRDRVEEFYTDDLEDRTAKLLDTIREGSSVVLSAWTYVGIFYDDLWVEKHYKWEDDALPPKRGDVLEATGSVNLRRDYIRYDTNTGQWVNADIVGLVNPGDKVRVESVENVADGFYWVKGEVVQ